MYIYGDDDWPVNRMGLTLYLLFTRNMEALRSLFLTLLESKTVTVRHRETQDREVEQSECCAVMVQITVGTLLGAKAC
jgi:hypothetical protein